MLLGLLGLRLLGLLRGLLQRLLRLLGVALLERLGGLAQVLRKLRVALALLLGLLAQVLRKLLALLGRHLRKLLGQLIELLRGLVGIAGLLAVLARSILQAARKIFQRRAARVAARVDALLQLVFHRRQVGQRLLAAARVFAQLALKLGKLRVERGALFGRERLVLRDLLAQLLGLVGNLRGCLLHGGALGQHRRLWVGQHRQRHAQRQRAQRKGQRAARNRNGERQHARAQRFGNGARIVLLLAGERVFGLLAAQLKRGGKPLAQPQLKVDAPRHLDGGQPAEQQRAKHKQQPQRWRHQRPHKQVGDGRQPPSNLQQRKARRGQPERARGKQKPVAQLQPPPHGLEPPLNIFVR